MNTLMLQMFLLYTKVIYEWAIEEDARLLLKAALSGH